MTRMGGFLMQQVFSRIIHRSMFQISLLFIFYISGNARIIHISPDKVQKIPSIAAMIANDGDTVNIEAGVYLNDVAVWRQNNLTIRGINGKAHMKAPDAYAEGKAIWVVKGNNTVIENIEFSEASVPDENGAGIRQEGTNLTIRNCFFHDNENGILTGKNLNSEIIIENTEFARNGYGDGQSHNIYIGQIKSFTLRFCYSHHAYIGHNVKSRAANNFILYNRIMDENDGESSFAIDLPNGGKSFIIGNLIQQGPDTDNNHLISYGAEGLNNPQNALYIINNTFVNQRGAGVFIRVADGTEEAKIMNNIFAGPGTVLNGPGQLVTNLDFPDILRRLSFLGANPRLVDLPNFDYRLTKDSPAVNAGTDPGVVDGFNLVPEWQYVHPMNKQKRTISGTIDVGAYEFSKE